jgi:hypothetical protein
VEAFCAKDANESANHFDLSARFNQAFKIVEIFIDSMGDGAAET